MSEFWGWLDNNQSALTGLQAMVAMVLLIPAGLAFLFGQIQQILLRREERYLNINERWQDFLELTLDHGDTGAADYAPVTDSAKLTPDQLFRRDTLFEMLTSIFERARILYRGQYEKAQWKGWQAYIDFYCARPDYAEWAKRNLVDIDEPVKQTGGSEYDRGFENFMRKRLIHARDNPAPWIASDDGRWKRA